MKHYKLTSSSLARLLAVLMLAFTLNGSLRAEPVELIVNGSFESGDFSDWNIAMTGSPFLSWQVSQAGMGGGFGMAPTAPQDGQFDAWNGFDGAGPMEFILDQVVSLPADHAAALSWSHRIQWNFALVNTATEPRLFLVEALNPDDDSVLQTEFSFSTKTKDIFPTGDTGWVDTSVDLSNLAGRTVKIRFTEFIPQVFTGPAQLELDTISVAVPRNAPVLGPVARGPNGHFYQVIGDWVSSWDKANAAATALTLCGKPGHLVTITSKQENDFVNSFRSAFVSQNGGESEFWAGGFQANKNLEPGGNWVWVNNEGPFPGANNGPVFADWAAGEPNDCGGIEDHLTVGRFANDSRPEYNFDGSLWNDEGCSPLSIAGYIVEYDSDATVIIGGCDSGVPNIVVGEGFCTLSDSIAQCAAGARNHGAFVSCVAALTDRLVKDGVISGKQKGAIQSCAASANTP